MARSADFFTDNSQKSLCNFLQRLFCYGFVTGIVLEWVYKMENCREGDYMTDRELRKLSRSDLLEMLVDLSEELNLVKQQLEATEEKLNNRQILIDKAGSIAEASLQLNGVFEAAEAASEQYVENLRNLSDRQDEIYRRVEAECREKAERRLEEVERKCMQMEADTIERCAKMQAMAKAETRTTWKYSYGARA